MAEISNLKEKLDICLYGTACESLRYRLLVINNPGYLYRVRQPLYQLLLLYEVNGKHKPFEKSSQNSKKNAYLRNMSQISTFLNYLFYFYALLTKLKQIIKLNFPKVNINKVV